MQLGPIIQDLKDKAFLFLEKLNSMDLSENGIKTLVETLQKTTSEFESKFGPTKSLPPQKQSRAKKIEEKAS
jgi:hypothetical protein